MRSRISRLFYLGVLTIGLGYTISRNGGFGVWGWNVCLLMVGLAAAAYWLLNPSTEAAPSLQPWQGRALFLLPAYVALQLVPLPLFLVQILSPARAELAQNLGAVTQRPDFAALSVAPSATSSYLLRTVGYLVVFLLVREITWRARRGWPWASLVPLIVIGALEAGLGILQNSQGAEVTGTYENRNHFAGLLEMILPGSLACGIAFLRGHRFQPPSISRTLKGSAFVCVATAIFVAIVYSQSKMGFVAALGALFFVGALTFGVRLPGRWKWAALAIAAAMLLGVFIFLPSDQVINEFGRLFVDDTTGEGRLPIAANTLHLIAAYPVFGTGLGNYGSAFVKYQTDNVDVAFTFAHNDYLQLLAELGIAGVLLLASFMLPIFRKAVRTALHAADPNTRYLALGCAGGMAAIGLHSLTDFNLYLPANATVLAWLAGISAGLSPVPEDPLRNEDAGVRIPWKKAGVALSFLLIVFASGWLLFEARFRNDPQAENLFCRFGICDIDSVLAAQTAAQDGNLAKAPQAELLEALRRDPATPGRWCDLGESLYRTGQTEQARRCFATALALGPHVPPILLRAANFYHGVGEDSRALELASHTLAKTAVYEIAAFDWFAEAKLPVLEILSHGLPQDPRVFRAYLRHLEDSGDIAGAAKAWEATTAHGYVDDKVALEYVNFLFGRNQYQAAAQAWAAYLGEREPGYLKSNWVYNGDFESELSHLPLDWSAGSAEGVKVERDADVRHSGRYSLRIRFEGKQNLSDAGVGQTATVTPGRYRFEAYIKTREITTDQGIRLRIFDPVGTLHMEMPAESLLGTNDWTKLSASICVPQTKLLTIGLVRQPSLKFDNLIKGTLWIDSVSLSKIAESCSA